MKLLVGPVGQRSHKVVQILLHLAIDVRESFLVKVLAVPSIASVQLASPRVEHHHATKKEALAS